MTASEIHIANLPRLNTEDLLDQALAASFPTSDPIAIARQVSAPPTRAGLHSASEGAWR